jgi:threonine/homoserine/homoserine lactone efflux protein
MGIHDIWLFLVAGLLLNVTPGPDMALVIARSTQQGTRAGIAAALGVGAGAFVHIAAAAIGLSAALVTSALAFTVLKWIGAIYLVFLGVQLIRASFATGADADGQAAFGPMGLWQIFIQGALTNVLNPKVAVFFLAFLPQFVDADAPSKVAAFIVLGLLFDVMGPPGTLPLHGSQAPWPPRQPIANRRFGWSGRSEPSTLHASRRHLQPATGCRRPGWRGVPLEGLSARWTDRWKTMTLQPHEFIRLFLMHGLPKGFHRIRHYGLFANGNRAANIALLRKLLSVPAGVEESVEQATCDDQRQLPCPCPRCGGRMIIIEAFAAGMQPTSWPVPTQIRIDTS